MFLTGSVCLIPEDLEGGRVVFNNKNTTRPPFTLSGTKRTVPVLSTSPYVFFIVRELVKEGAISIHYISTEHQLADIGTKFLSKHRLRLLLDLIKNIFCRLLTCVLSMCRLEGNVCGGTTVVRSLPRVLSSQSPTLPAVFG